MAPKKKRNHNVECVMEGFLIPPVAVKCKLINYHFEMVLGKLGCDILHFKQCGLFLICSTSWQLASRPSAGAGEVSRDLSCQFVAHPSPGVTPVLP